MVYEIKVKFMKGKIKVKFMKGLTGGERGSV